MKAAPFKKIFTLSLGWQILLWLSYGIYEQGISSISIPNLKIINSNIKSVAIQKIVQDVPLDHYLPTDILAELLDLSQDKPTLRGDFSTENYEKKLAQLPCFSHIRISWIDSTTLYLNYRLEAPWFRLENYPNTLLLKNGSFAAHTPFYRANYLPILRLDAKTLNSLTGWGDQLCQASKDKIREIWDSLESLQPFITRIDLEHLNHVHPKKREIILSLKIQEHSIFLRLAQNTSQETLRKLLFLLSTKPQELPSQELRFCIDARIPCSVTTQLIPPPSNLHKPHSFQKLPAQKS